MPRAIKIRRATARDANSLIAFNRAMALETERKDLWPRVIGAGVRRLLRRPDSGFYSVAEIDGQVIGALMVTKEWSDWRNGDFWWIQSVYVHPDCRRRGVYRRMYAYLTKLAARDRAVVGFRLYVEENNRRAQSTYRASGMERTHYLVFESLKPGVRFFTRVAAGSSRRGQKARTAR